ncbi:MAG: GNAT family N-acetyltransferase [Bacteriovoracia bacterium]
MLARTLFFISILIFEGLCFGSQKDLTKGHSFLLETQRTKIRLVRVEDIPRLTEFQIDRGPEYGRMNGFSEEFWNEEKVRLIVEESNSSIPKAKSLPKVKGINFDFGIWFEGYLVGVVGFATNPSVGFAKNVGAIRKSANCVALSYGLDPTFRGIGLAEEAVREIIGYLFEDLGYDAVTAVILEQNIPSIKLVDKIGFESFGVWTGYYGGIAELQSFIHHKFYRKQWKPCDRLLKPRETAR